MLSSISSALLAWSVNQTLTEENSVLTVFIIVKECGEIFINCPNSLFGAKWIKLSMYVDNRFLLDYNVLKQLQQILI